MKKAEIDRIKRALLRRESELRSLEESSRDTTQPVELDQASVGRLSRMDAMQGQQMALEGARRRQQELAKIEGSLRRIELGEYGNCTVCGEEIDVRRLMVAPTSTRCVPCAET
jgi:DnaK suppressor protein